MSLILGFCLGSSHFFFIAKNQIHNYIDFGPWEEKGFAPEAEFLEKIKAIPGISVVETQTITNMEI